MRFRYVIVIFCVLLMPSAWATSFVPIPDENLLQQTQLVVLGRVLNSGPAADSSDFTDYLVQVTEVLKGVPAADTIVVRVLGSHDLNTGSLIVPGAPHFTPDESVLLFLTPQAGHYALQQFTLGAFHQRSTADGHTVLMRDLTGAEEFGGDGKALLLPATDQARDLRKFRSWLQNRAQGHQADSSYWSSSTANDTVTKENFTTLNGNDNNGISRPARWFEFDGGQNISFFASRNAQAGLSGGGITQFQQGLAAWNNDPNSNVRYDYGGTTTANGGLANADGVNAILFNDPNNEIPGTFDCNNGGILAQGGFRSSSSTHSFNGTAFVAITEVDIVIQNGTGCYLSGDNGRNAAEVFAHEIGHSLGLGHSCGDNSIVVTDCTLNASANDALMRAFPHADGRGASLSADDRNGIAFLYPNTSSTAVVPPTNTSGATSSHHGGGGATDPAALLILASFSLMFAYRRRQSSPA